MTAKDNAYSKAGVNYAGVDPVKVLAQQKAKSTAKNLKVFSAKEVERSRGESAYVWEEEDAFRALVIEGLGTKNLIADEVRKITNKTYYDQIAQDAVAMIVNDLIVVGALPQVINAYFAIGDADWMTDAPRATDLVNGWAKACDAVGAVWGGGETPPLKGIIDPKTIDLAGSAVGIIKPKNRLILGDELAAGDVIVLIASSGIHSNGLTLVRSLAEKKPGLYKQKLSSGQMFGEAILTPTHLYVALVRSILEADVKPHYMVNITGHGWRKLMRSTKEFSYVIDKISQPQEEFEIIQKLLGASDYDMYSTLNMGAGFAIYSPSNEVNKIIKLAADNGLKAWVAGKVEDGPKQVVIKPKKITFAADTLEVR